MRAANEASRRHLSSSRPAERRDSITGGRQRLWRHGPTCLVGREERERRERERFTGRREDGKAREVFGFMRILDGECGLRAPSSEMGACEKAKRDWNPQLRPPFSGLPVFPSSCALSLSRFLIGGEGRLSEPRDRTVAVGTRRRSRRLASNAMVGGTTVRTRPRHERGGAERRRREPRLQWRRRLRGGQLSIGLLRRVHEERELGRRRRGAKRHRPCRREWLLALRQRRVHAHRSAVRPAADPEVRRRALHVAAKESTKSRARSHFPTSRDGTGRTGSLFAPSASRRLAASRAPVTTCAAISV